MKTLLMLALMVPVAGAAGAPRELAVPGPAPEILVKPADQAQAQQLWLHHSVEAPRGRPSAPAVTRLREAQTLLGPRPSVVQRLLPTGSALAAVEQARAALLEAQATLRLDGSDDLRRLQLLEERLPAGAEEAKRRIQQARRLLHDRLAHFDAEAVGVVATLDAHASAGTLLREAAELGGADARTGLDALIEKLHDWGDRPTERILSADLTYVEGGLTTPGMPDGGFHPAYLSADTGVQPALDDGSAGREVELSPEIQAKAASLIDARGAWSFVKNETRLEWYSGAMKGSTATLRSLRGNDVDLATLLIALLRAQGIPARYVRGTIELPVGRVADLLGLLDDGELQLLYAAGPSPAPFVLPPAKRDLALRALSAAGIPYTPMVAAGQVAAVQMAHTWVEAYVPYADYRGAAAGINPDGRQWVAMDPAIPGVGKYEASTPALDGWAGLNSSAQQVSVDYLAATGPASPLDFLKVKVQQYAAGQGSSYAQTLRTVAQRSELLELLPGTLPYRVVSVEGESAFVPEALRHRLQFVATDGAGTLLDATFPLHQLLEHRAVWGYKPATAVDEQIVAVAGSLYSVPAAVVQVLPVVRVDGREVAVGTRAVPLGGFHALSLEMKLPDGSVRRIDNQVLAGNFIAVGLSTSTNTFVESAAFDPLDTEPLAGRFLYARAALYANAWGRSEDELAQLLRVVPLRPTASLVLVENQLRASQTVGVLGALTFTGLEMDADLRTMSPLELKPGRGKELLRLSGMQGSFLEAQVLADAAQVQAVSSTSVLQEAAAQGLAVLVITPANQGTELPRLQASAAVRADVTNHLSLGREVRIPESPLTLRDWSGTGYIARNPATEEAGYFLSGRVSGGQTIVSPSTWPNTELVKILSQPSTAVSTSDTTKVARIVKVPATDFQLGTVGVKLPLPLTVLVTTLNGIPVTGATVTFKRFDTGQPLFYAPLSQAGAVQLTAVTDASGRAVATVAPDTDIANLAVHDLSVPNSQPVAFNRVQAEVAAGPDTLVLAEPFTLIGRPDAPNQLQLRPQTDYTTEVGLQLSPTLTARLTDKWGNPIANRAVTWTGAPARGRFRDGTQTADQLWDAALPNTSLQQVTPTNGLVRTSFIPDNTPASYAVDATVAAGPGHGAISGRYTVATFAPTEGVVDPATGVFSIDAFTFRVAVPLLSNFNGVKGVSFSEPVTAQIFRYRNGSWAQVTAGPGIDARVTMQTSNEAGTVLETVSSILTTVHTFRPRYLLDNGLQRVTFTADVQLPGRPSPCCGNFYFLTAVSAKPVLTPSRLDPNSLPLPAGPCGVAPASDTAVSLTIEHPSVAPLYLELLQPPGTPAVLVPSAQVLSRHPTNPSLFRVPPNLTSTPLPDGSYQFNRFTLNFPLNPAGPGGQLTFNVKAADVDAAGSPILRDVASQQVQVQPSGAPTPLLARTQKLNPTLTLPVRNFESTRNPAPGALAPTDATEPPILGPAPLEFCALEAGMVRVKLGTVTLSEASVALANGFPALTAVVGGAPVPGLLPDGALQVPVPPPSDTSVGLARIEFTPAGPGAPAVVSVPVKTLIRDIGVLPVGHTFVKDVSVADGHLVKQREDLRLAGRGPPLSFGRTYSNRSGRDDAALGPGWTHALNASVTEVPGALANSTRFVVVGGEGSGQVFTCGPLVSGCTPQRGYHGTLRGEGGAVVFRSKGGVEYRFGNAQLMPDQSLRRRLQSITDVLGRRLAFSYGDASIDGALARVTEVPGGRSLELTYQRKGALQLAAVRALGSADASLGMCVGFGYDPKGRLTSATRYDGECVEGGVVLSTETYGYLDSAEEGLNDNLTRLVDPNGRETTFSYYAANDALPGEAAFSVFEDKVERVRAVVEPLGAVTRFEYALTQSTVMGPSGPQLAFKTEVQGPRPAVPATKYFMDGYGASSRVERPLNSSEVAVSRTRWDTVHLRVDEEVDPRGRRTSLAYDALGNLTEKRTQTTVLAAAGSTPATEGVVDGQGSPVVEVVEQWTYDLAFARPTCHLDREGRVTTFTLDSSGLDPRVALDAGTGLVLATTRLATERAPGSGCAAPATTAADITTRTRYCQVGGVSCNTVTGPVKGDVFETEDGEGSVTTVLAYDAYGNALQTRKATRLTTPIVTDSTFDDRSRLKTQVDTFGHDSAWEYDGLDRPILITRKNTKGGSPDLVQELTYYPAGQVKTETNGLGLLRTTVLDELNRPFTVTETGGGLTAPLVTTHLYDEAGNETFTTDRRGARTERHFDFADRLIKTEVTAGSGFAGEVTLVGVGGVTAEFEYDAAGNKVAEEDLHGHRTTFSLDALYRVVSTTSPEVPGATAGASPLPYTTRRRFDLVGNKVRETDGNGHAMTMAYDFANRATTTTDAVGRVEFRTYDRAGNVLTSTKRFGAVNHLIRSMAYDGLNRPLSVGEVVLRTAGMGAAHNYTQQTVYDDAAHTVATKDRRGFVTLRRLDDLDRVFEEVVDATHPLRSPGPNELRAGPALALTTHASYDANGNPSVSQDALGRTTTTTFDGLNRVRSRAMPMGVSETFEPDGEGHVVSHTDVRGIVRTAKFDLLGRPTKQYLRESISNGGADLLTSELVYFDAADPGDGRTTRTEENARGNVTRHLEDALHREVETIDAQFHSVVSRYDATVRRETVDRRGYLTRFTFDDADRPLGSSDFDLGGTSPRYSQSTTYNDTLRTVSSLDRRGIPSVQHLDGLGRVEKTTRGTAPLQQVVQNTFNAAGAVTQATDPNGHVTESVFDGAGRLLETTRGLATVDASRTTFTHDAVGNRLESKSARVTGVPYDVRESFDDLNRAVRTEDALGNVTTRAFDAAGNKRCEKRPLGGAVFAHGAAAGMTVAQLDSSVCAGSQLTRWSYDETGALRSTTDALGGHWTFLYDVTRNLIAKQDANLQLTTFEFDSLDRRTKEHQHLDAHPRQTSRASLPPVLAHNGPAFTSGTLTWSRTYDFSGNVLTTTDAKGQVATNTWGILNRLDKTDYSHLPGRALPSLDGIDYGFDENGNLEDVIERKTVTTPSGSPGPSTETTLRTFDLLDRLKTELRYDGKLVQYGYDLKGNRTQVLDSSAVATDYTFDALDRVKTAVLGGGTTTYTYWPDSLPKGVVFPASNGIREGRCYDDAGRLTALLTARGAISDLCTTAAAVVSRYDYGFDANGNRTSQLEQRTNPATQALGTVEPTSYGYDDDDRLVGVRYADTGALYRLDAVGNRTGERRALASKISALTVAAFAAIAPADLTHDITSVFTRADWLASRRDALHASDDVDLTYDANGNTLSKITPSNTRAFAWDCRDTLVSVSDNGVDLGRYDYDRNLQRVKRTAGAEKVEYVLDDKYVLQEADGSQSSHPATRRYHYAAQPLAVADGAGLKYLNVDALGSVADATSTVGVLATVRQYNAWGEYRNNTAPTPSEPKLGYTGHQFDVESGLVYARARYYDPALGTFLSRDSLEGNLSDAPSLHRFAYVKFNPLRYTDFNGFCAEPGSCPPAAMIEAFKDSLREKSGAVAPPKSTPAHVPNTQGGGAAAEAILSAPGDATVALMELAALSEGRDLDGNQVAPEVQKQAKAEIEAAQRSMRNAVLFPPAAAVEAFDSAGTKLAAGASAFADDNHAEGARNLYYGFLESGGLVVGGRQMGAFAVESKIVTGPLASKLRPPKITIDWLGDPNAYNSGTQLPKVKLEFGSSLSARERALKGTAKEAEWVSPKQGEQGPGLRDHFAKHGEQVGAGTPREFDLSARDTIQNGREFTYVDKSSGERRVGYWDENTGLFTATSQDRKVPIIRTHFPLQWEDIRKFWGFSVK